jgi:hypothetical protein
MFLVFVTALATWAFMVLLNVINYSGGFIVGGAIAVIGGAATGLLVSWYRMRQRRKERRQG